jgi:hypothetical protein
VASDVAGAGADVAGAGADVAGAGAEGAGTFAAEGESLIANVGFNEAVLLPAEQTTFSVTTVVEDTGVSQAKNLQGLLGF